MDNRNPEFQQQKNSELSLALIVVIVVLSTILYSNVASSEDAKILIIPVMIWVATVYISTKVTPPFRAKVAASLTAGCSKN